MTLAEKKKILTEYRDFFGGDLLESEMISSAKTHEELSGIINRHESHLEAMHADALSHLNDLRKKAKLIGI